MLQNLLDMIKGLGQDHVVDNPEIPNEHNDAVMAEATNSVAGGLQNAMANGQGGDITALLNRQPNENIMNNPVAQGMQASFLGNIESKLGIATAGGSTISSFIPAILQKLVHGNNGTGQGFDIQSLISSLTGGSNSGTATAAQGQPSGGGLMDTIKGLMHF